MATEGWWIFKYDPLKGNNFCYELIECCCIGDWLLELLCVGLIKDSCCCCLCPPRSPTHDMMVAERDAHLATPAAVQAMHGQGQWQGPPQWQAGGVVNHQPQHLPQMHVGAAGYNPHVGDHGFNQQQKNRIPRVHYPNGH